MAARSWPGALIWAARHFQLVIACLWLVLILFEALILHLSPLCSNECFSLAVLVIVCPVLFCVALFHCLHQQFDYYNSQLINEKDENDNYVELGDEFILEPNEHFNNLLVNTTYSDIQLPTNVYNKGKEWPLLSHCCWLGVEIISSDTGNKDGTRKIITDN